MSVFLPDDDEDDCLLIKEAFGEGVQPDHPQGVLLARSDSDDRVRI